MYINTYTHIYTYIYCIYMPIYTSELILIYINLIFGFIYSAFHVSSQNVAYLRDLTQSNCHKNPHYPHSSLAQFVFKFRIRQIVQFSFGKYAIYAQKLVYALRHAIRALYKTVPGVYFSGRSFHCWIW